MKNKLFHKFKQAQDGAAVLMVLLVTVFVVIMGSSVLFSSYNGYLVQLVDRQGVDTFYVAEDYLTQTKAVVQDFASDSLQTAYTKVMSEYAFLVQEMTEVAENQAILDGYTIGGGYTETEISDYISELATPLIQEAAQAEFTILFLEELNKSMVVTDASAANGTGHAFTTDSSLTDSSIGYLFTFENYLNGTKPSDYFSTQVGGNPTDVWEGKYNAAALGSLVGFDSDATLTLSSANNSVTGSPEGYFSLTKNMGGDRLTLHDVMISYTTEDGYQAYITSDIVIEMPDFVHNGDTSFSTGWDDQPPMSGLDNAASIGGFWVKAAHDVNITGDIYAGDFFLYNEDNAVTDSNQVFNHTDGRLVTHNDFITRYNSKAEFEASGDASGYFDEDSNDFYENFNTGTIINRLEGFEIYNGMIFQSDDEIWAKNISIYKNGEVNFFENSVIYVEGDIILEEGASFNMYPNSYLYVQGDIIAYGGATVNLLGDAYVGGDLVAKSGKDDMHTKITIAGTYNGYSSGTTSAKSSSILLAGDNIDLDMSGLNKLSLAGLTYLTPGREDASNSEYALGQSMTALPDQIAYLIPAEALSGVSANPTSENSDIVTVNLNYELWTGSGKTIGNYMTVTTPKVIKYNYQGNDNEVSYFFLDFGSDWTTNANAYFNDYIRYNGDSLTENFQEFVNMTTTDGQTYEQNTAGGVYYNDTSAGLQSGTNAYSSFVVDLPDKFPSLSVNLTTDENVSQNKGKNPYTYYVKQDWLDADISKAYESYLHGLTFRENGTGGNILGVYRKSGGRFQGHSIAVDHAEAAFGPVDSANLYAIVCQTGINIEAANTGDTFTGLALSGVGVMIDSDMKSDKYKFYEALDATVELKLLNGTIAVPAGDNVTDVYNSLTDTIKAQVDDAINSRVNSAGEKPTLGVLNGIMTLVVPMSAYFDFDGEPGDDGLDPYAPGANDLTTKVNWEANDLVYFENWEKH